MTQGRRKLLVAIEKNLFGLLVLGIWDLFVICDLVLGIYYFLKHNHI
jgi:hypothetical protein